MNFRLLKIILVFLSIIVTVIGITASCLYLNPNGTLTFISNSFMNNKNRMEFKNAKFEKTTHFQCDSIKIITPKKTVSITDIDLDLNKSKLKLESIDISRDSKHIVSKLLTYHTACKMIGIGVKITKYIHKIAHLLNIQSIKIQKIDFTDGTKIFKDLSLSTIKSESYATGFMVMAQKHLNVVVSNLSFSGINIRSHFYDKNSVYKAYGSIYADQAVIYAKINKSPIKLMFNKDSLLVTKLSDNKNTFLSNISFTGEYTEEGLKLETQFKDLENKQRHEFKLKSVEFKAQEGKFLFDAEYDGIKGRWKIDTDWKNILKVDLHSLDNKFKINTITENKITFIEGYGLGFNIMGKVGIKDNRPINTDLKITTKNNKIGTIEVGAGSFLITDHSVTLAVNNMGTEKLKIDNLNAVYNLQNDKWKIATNSPYDLVIEGYRKDKQVIINYLKGKLGEYDLFSNNAINISYNKGNVSLEDCKVKVNQGEIKGFFQYVNNDIKSNWELKNVPVYLSKKLKYVMGSTSGSIKLSGAKESPMLDALLFMHGKELESKKEKVSLYKTFASNTSGSIKCNIRDQILNCDVDLHNPYGLQLIAQMVAPVTFNYKHFSFNEKQPIIGKVNSKINLRLIKNRLTKGHEIAGDINIGLKVNGTLEKPQLIGSINLDNLNFEHYKSGFAIDKGIVKIDANSNRLNITKAFATDKKQGKINLEGYLDLNNKGIQEGLVVANFSEFKMADTVQLSVRGSGTVKATAKNNFWNITGDLRNDKSTFLAGQFSDDPGVKVYYDTDKSKERILTNEAISDKVKGLINFKVEDNLFFEGYGANAKLGNGGIQIKYDETLSITGAIKLIAGNFKFAGMDLELGEGAIEFRPNRLDPYIGIFATNPIPEGVAKIGLAGYARDMQLTVSSTPALPNDEILSRLLFNEKRANLSFLQGLKLAEAIRQMNLSRGGLNKAFSKMLDIFDFKQQSRGSAPGKDSIIRAGYKLNSLLYIGYEKNITPQNEGLSDMILLALRINKNTSMELSNAGIGLNWHFDY